MSYSSTVLSDSPLAYWKLDETTGATQFADATGSGHAATISGTPTYSTSSKVDVGSVGFSGSQYGSVPTSIGGWLSSTNTYSVEAWFKTTATGNRALVMYDNSNQSPGSATRFFMFYVSNGAVIFLPFNTAGTVVSVTSPSSNYNDDIWHHAVGTWDGSTVNLYIDGSLVGSRALSGSAPTGGGQPMLIGSGYNNAPGNYLQYVGSIDEVAVYGSTLSPTQVSTHYSVGAAGLPPSQARVETLFTETLVSGTPNVQVEATFTEALVNGTRLAQVEAAYAEVLVAVQPTQVESVYIEEMVNSTPPVRTETLYLESMMAVAAPPVRVEANYIEFMVQAVAAQRFVGWGARI